MYVTVFNSSTTWAATFRLRELHTTIMSVKHRTDLAALVEKSVPAAQESLGPHVVHKDGEEPVEGVERQVHVVLLKVIL